MRKRVLAIVAVIVVIALAFVAGILAQRERQLAQIRAAEKFARDLTGLDDPVPAAPHWDEWRYPNAESAGTIQGAALRIMGELVRPAGRYAVLVTNDDVETVARHYAEKMQFDKPDDMAASRLATFSQGTLQGESNHLLDDSSDSADHDRPRPVRVKCLIRRCPAYDLTVFITRADDEPRTHVLLTYDPKVETRGGPP